VPKCARFQASGMVKLSSLPFWVVTQCWLVVVFRHFGAYYWSQLQGSKSRKRTGVTGCPNTSLNNYQSMLCNNLEDPRSRYLVNLQNWNHNMHWYIFYSLKLWTNGKSIYLPLSGFCIHEINHHWYEPNCWRNCCKLFVIIWYHLFSSGKSQSSTEYIFIWGTLQ
jgi:hypothetical protein